MIYAVPLKNNCVSNHFSKSTQFAFFNEDNSLIQNCHNPTTGQSSCQNKNALIALIKEMNTDAVIIRHIGERALGKLLSEGIRVFQLSSQTLMSEAIYSPMHELTEASQGKTSVNHMTKGCVSHANQVDDIYLNKGARKARLLKGNLNEISSLKPFNK